MKVDKIGNFINNHIAAGFTLYNKINDVIDDLFEKIDYLIEW